MRTLRVAAVLLALLGAGPAVAGESGPRSFALPAGANPVRLILDGEGSVWFASRALGAVGSLDPATGAHDLLSLGAGAKPASLDRASDGRLFAVDAASDLVHEIDPATRDVKRHAIPSESGLLELSSGALDGEGRLWFTGYGGSYGRLDPATGEVAVWPAPGGRGPVAMTRGRDGALWYASYTAAHIVRLDPATGRVEPVDLPAGQEGPKSLAVDAGGRVWVAAHRSKSLLRFDPGTRSWAAWRLPGEDPKPYAVAIDDRGRLWLTDTGEHKLLRFDVQTERFKAVVPTAWRATARDVLPAGEAIWVAETAADQILRVPLALAAMADRR